MSVALHVIAVLWFVTHGDPDVHPAPHSREVAVEIVPPSAADPVAVTYLDPRAMRAFATERAPERDVAASAPTPRPEPSEPADADERGPARSESADADERDQTRSESADADERDQTRPRGHQREEISATQGRQIETPGREPRPNAGSGSGSSLMKMRGPDLSTGPPKPWVDDFLTRSKPLEKDPEPSGQLHPSGNGRYQSHQGTFAMTVDRDGSAHIKDGPNLHVGIALPSPKGLGKALSEWAEDPYKAGGEAGKNQLRGEYHALGEDEKPQSSNVVGIPILGGGFDATDWMMRRHGQDPYASKKLHVLDSTRDERVQIGKQHRTQQLARSTELMQNNLERVRASALDPQGRKQALFELWDECAETGDALLVEGGRAARTLVIGFIRATLPSSSSDAYTPAELAHFNRARQSSAQFSPYN